jgi:exodeoxyribonuclease-5
MWEVGEIADKFRCFGMLVNSLDESRDPLKIEVPEEYFNGTDQKLDWRERRKYDEFTFGWAITCHKSQGSEWPNVLVFDESGAFREHRANWLYTAITRAAGKVTVVL